MHREPTVTRRKPGLKSTVEEQNEETRIQKNEERLRNLWNNFKPTSKSWGCQHEKRKRKILKTYLNK